MLGRSLRGSKRDLSIFIIFGLIMIFSAACGGPSTVTTEIAPLKIGIALSLSGEFSVDGIALERGYQIWADHVNAQGGLIGRKVMLDILDDTSSPDQVQISYQRLITMDKVDLVFGPFSTVLTKPASLVASQYGYALLEGAGGGPSIFNRGLQNVFDVSLPVTNGLVSFVHYILSLPVAKRPTTAAYATEDDPFTQPQVDQARALLERGGVKTLSNQVYSSGNADYNLISDAVVISNPQIVVFGTVSSLAISAYIQHFKRLHYNPKVLIATAGPDQGTAFLKAIGGAASAEGVFFPNGWYPQLKTPANDDLVKDYLKRYKGHPDDISADTAEAYAVGQVAFQAITKIKSFNNAKLIAELHSGDTFQSVQGTVKFDATGQNIAAPGYLFQWQNGTFMPVYPVSGSLALPELPKPNWPQA